ncbi:MAG: hypothetical protein H8E51_07725 [Bacteroidetes bacterium]|nr:hypothetical protein [Bacteroidota bacterium]
MFSTGIKPGALSGGRLILISALFFLSCVVSAQYHFNSQCREAYQEILNFRFEAAQNLLQKERQEHPENLIPVYLENYIDFFKLYTRENKLEFELLKGNKSKRLKLLEDGNQKSPYYRLCLAGVRIQWAFVKLKFGEYMTAAFDIRRAYLLLKENEKLFPEFLPDKVGQGILHIIVGLIPENYLWLANLVGLEGTISEGIAELNSVFLYNGSNEVYKLFKPEACFYLAFVYANLHSNKQESLEFIRRFDLDTSFIQYKNSPLIVFAKSSVYMKNGRNDEVIALLSSYQPDAETYPFLYLEFLEGLAHINRLDTSASNYFNTFLDEFKGINYIKSGHQKLAWIYLLKGDTLRYKAEIMKAKVNGHAIVDDDKQAYAEYDVGIIPALPLLKARLLFDGGYYREALNILLNTSLDQYIRSRKDLTEYTYRLGRIHHAVGNIPRAEEFYTQTIKLGKKIPHYFAANAALNLGMIYEKRGDFIGADTNYRICASLKHAEYENSLRQKAKAGLSRLKRANR